MITNLFLSVAEISLSVSLIVLLMLLLSPLFTKRYGSKWSYWIWIFLALRLLIPFRGADGSELPAAHERDSHLYPFHRIPPEWEQGEIAGYQENHAQYAYL